MEILNVQNLSKHYGSGETIVKALDEVSFSVEKGQFMLLLARVDRVNRLCFISSAGGWTRPPQEKSL